MNKDQVKGVTKDIAGKAQEAVGRIAGDKTQEAKGLTTQAEGKVQKGFGDVKDTVNKAGRDTH